MENSRLSVEQAAQYLGVGLSWLYKKVQEGRGPSHYRLGQRYQFAQKDLDEYLLAHRVDSPEVES